MKIFAVLSLITLAIVACLLIGAEGNNVTYGAIDKYSRLLEQRPIRIKHKTLRVVDETVQFPAKGQVNYYTLTAVKVIDHKKKDGGIVYLVKNGPGYRNATLRLKSERGHGLDYTILYYGR